MRIWILTFLPNHLSPPRLEPLCCNRKHSLSSPQNKYGISRRELSTSVRLWPWFWLAPKRFQSTLIRTCLLLHRQRSNARLSRSWWKKDRSSKIEIAGRLCRTQRLFAGSQITLPEDPNLIWQEAAGDRMQHAMVVEHCHISFVPINRIH